MLPCVFRPIEFLCAPDEKHDLAVRRSRRRRGAVEASPGSTRGCHPLPHLGHSGCTPCDPGRAPGAVHPWL